MGHCRLVRGGIRTYAPIGSQMPGARVGPTSHSASAGPTPLASAMTTPAATAASTPVASPVAARISTAAPVRDDGTAAAAATAIVQLQAQMAELKAEGARMRTLLEREARERQALERTNTREANERRRLELDLQAQRDATAAQRA
jgi:hypothetical protein